MSKEQPVSITMNDLAVAVRLIDTAVERGGFRGPEITTVGTVRERLVRFIEANQDRPEVPSSPAVNVPVSADVQDKPAKKGKGSV